MVHFNVVNRGSRKIAFGSNSATLQWYSTAIGIRIKLCIAEQKWLLKLFYIAVPLYSLFDNTDTLTRKLIHTCTYKDYFN
jgi:hypothetical protein